jgi:hypothetical protein
MRWSRSALGVFGFLPETAKLNDFDPFADLSDILAHRAQGHPTNCIAKFLS